MPVKVSGNNYYRVRVGPFESTDQANYLLAQVTANGYDQAKIIHD